MPKQQARKYPYFLAFEWIRLLEQYLKSSWYKRGGNEAIIFVPATPNSQLQKKYQTEIKRQGFKIKEVEKAGVEIKRLLQKSDPFKPRQCGREDCQVCRTEGKGPCNRESVTYEIKCIGCNQRRNERLPRLLCVVRFHKMAPVLRTCGKFRGF